MDGIFGRETASVVRAFERRQQLVVDEGIAGRQVIGRLDVLLYQSETCAQQASRILLRLARPNTQIARFRNRFYSSDVQQDLSNAEIEVINNLLRDTELILRDVRNARNNLDRISQPTILIANPGVLVLGGGAAVSVAPIVILIAAIIGIVLLAYFAIEILPDILEEFYILLSQAVTELVALRARVEEYIREGGIPEPCQPKYQAFLSTINTLIRRFQSPASRGRATSAFINGIRDLAIQLKRELLELLRCLDPNDTTGLIRRLVGPDGILTIAIENAGKILRLPFI